MVLTFSKTITTSGTPLAIRPSYTPCATVTFTAPTTNTGSVMVGDSTVLFSTRNGIQILPGDSYTFPFIGGNGSYDLQQIFADVQVNGEKVIATVGRS